MTIGVPLMKEKHIKYLICTGCKGDLVICRVLKKNNDSIEEGSLQCSKCQKTYNIVKHIPRFVPLENYASNFGFEWTKHAKTQYDSYSGVKVSEERFFNETRWPRNLSGQTILEVGSGSGRFTEHAISTGAMVVSMDYSYAVDASYASNGGKDNVLIIQGDLYNMPFREDFFDKLFCLGVLQHTPNVEKAFMGLICYLKTGGSLVIDVYRKPEGIKGFLLTKYWARMFTKKISPEILYRWCERYVTFMWPLATLIHKFPYGKFLNFQLLILDYMGEFNLSEKMLKKWTILDTFDMLSAVYDKPQSTKAVKQWFAKAKMEDVDVRYGYNGIEGRGTKR